MLAKFVTAVAIGVVFVAAPLTAGAADKGFYLGGAGGYNFLPEDSELGAVDADLDGDWAGRGALGYAFSNGLRREGEFGYCENDVDGISGTAGGTGGAAASVIRTRIMLTDMSTWREAARAHGEVFKDIRPVCTFVEVKGFIDPEWLVEMEMDCVIGEAR